MVHMPGRYVSCTPEPFPDGWRLLSAGARTGLERELALEIVPGHVLFSKALTVVSACQGCDDTPIFVEDAGASRTRG